jgi:hypothetical protein
VVAVVVDVVESLGPTAEALQPKREFLPCKPLISQ